MAKQMVEVDVPEGWEAAEFRVPRKGETYLARIECYVGLQVISSDVPQPFPAVIVRKSWQWPAWLKAPWIAMDEGGDWYCANKEPRLGECDCKHDLAGWKWGDWCIHLDSEVVDWTPPPCTDWRASKRRNPNQEPPDAKPA